MRWQWPAAESGALNTTDLGATGHVDMSPFEGDHCYCHCLYYNLALDWTTGKEQRPTHQHKIDLKHHWGWLCPSDQEPDSPRASPSHPEASKSLLSLSVRKQTEWKLQLQKTNQNWSHGSQPCQTIWNNNPMPCRGTQDGQVMVESSDKTCSTREGNGKPLHYSCLENHMNSMKRQKHMTLKDELPGQ